MVPHTPSPEPAAPTLAEIASRARRDLREALAHAERVLIRHGTTHAGQPRYAVCHARRVAARRTAFGEPGANTILDVKATFPQAAVDALRSELEECSTPDGPGLRLRAVDYSALPLFAFAG